ncbi:MAG TPA: polynucleotide adenylyltransferase PcnB [Polyangia bacterium]|nr:polynucleotide adenylyltransferase PcnB [Polyangia bacterium]
MNIAPDQIDPDAVKVVQRLREFGHAAYLVGGCVRDLLLGRKPKDFDVVTSATPNEIKRHFRNCRIIGRRFRLAHIFYGPKIIETSTFRANPREIEDDDGEGPETESGDLLIRRDNVFGTPEQDARRRDFTINGLFYDIETRQVIDHVSGLPDLEARVVRTIGDPDIRFREDPIRILRAVKFAARCDLTIEPETYRRMMEHRGEIAKCAQARVSEEFYRLLRAGAAKRSLELLVETELLELMVPDLAKSLKGEPADDEAALRRGRLWKYLEALDRSAQKRPVAPSNALLLATLMLPPLRDALDPDTNGVRDIGQLVAQSLLPPLERLRPSRRDSELARQILLALRFTLPSRRGRRRRGDMEGREFYSEALRLAEMVAETEAAEPSLAGRPILTPGTTLADMPAEPPADEIDPVAAELLESDRRFGRDRDRDRRPHGGAPRQQNGSPNGSPNGSGPRPSAPPSAPPMDLGSLAAAARALVTADLRPAFLGSGGFGGPWAARGD